MRLSIRAKQVLGVTALVGAVVTAMSVHTLAEQARVRLEESQARGQLLARAIYQRSRAVVPNAVDPYAAIRDDGGLRAILESSIYSQSVTYAAVVDTHMHADYLSGARAAAARWQVPYFVHADDAASPYDGTPGRFAHQALSDGDTIVVGRATLRAVHVPGHTLGSVALLADDGLALTGDFLFVRSVGRPDLGGQAETWAKQLWRSLERARREWAGELLVLPAHYSSEEERRADRAVAARFDVITATNVAVRIQDEGEFLRWLAEHQTTPPEAYRTIKEANLGLADVADADAATLESGPNQCAVR